MIFELLRNVVDGFLELTDSNVIPIVESVRTPAPITPYPTGRLVGGGDIPGTSCQATIAPSLRDISQYASARSRNRFVLQSFLSSSSDSDPDPSVPKLALSSCHSAQG
jgi:hypothetical protein